MDLYKLISRSNSENYVFNLISIIKHFRGEVLISQVRSLLVLRINRMPSINFIMGNRALLNKLCERVSGQ